MDTTDDFFEVVYRTVNLEVFGACHGSGRGHPGVTVREEPTLAKKHPQAQRWELGIPTSEGLPWSRHRATASSTKDAIPNHCDL